MVLNNHGKNAESECQVVREENLVVIVSVYQQITQPVEMVFKIQEKNVVNRDFHVEHEKHVILPHVNV
jgi:hypothetical protein